MVEFALRHAQAVLPPRPRAAFCAALAYCALWVPRAKMLARLKQMWFVFCVALTFYSQCLSAAPLGGDDLVSLLVCRACDEAFPRSTCLDSQEIQNTCLQNILEEEELLSRKFSLALGHLQCRIDN
ncbi:unnamed protein product [Hydatigera taeniaeformis]|uniref:Secreted protein n=1 Tax=Hydatigena taeniaeformis TaxID=6205 RepID=A0A0R3WLH9_HYDTA|nr:unnamed protein product [Hydatigera taeniaeformis]